MIREVKLHGALAERYGGQFQLNVMSVTEAVRALSVQLRGFRNIIARGEFQILVGGANLGEDELNLEIYSNAPIDIVPVPIGSKSSSGWIKVVLGVALLGWGFSVAATALNASVAAGVSIGWTNAMGTAVIGNISAQTFMTLGAGMVLSGVGLLLSPTPVLSSNEKPDDMPSYIFSGALNIGEEGNCIPLCYGTFLCGSLVVSSGLSIEDYSKILDTESLDDATYHGKGAAKKNAVSQAISGPSS